MNRIVKLLFTLLLCACGSADESNSLERHLGSLQLPYTADEYVIGWDQSDGWRGRYCGGWGSSQVCLLPPDRTIKWNMLDPTPDRNQSAIQASSALTNQIGGSWSWTAGSSNDYDILFYNAALGGSNTSSVISRYIHIACVDGTLLTESLSGTWMTCNRHEAAVDYAALAVKCPGTGLFECLKRVHSHGLARAAGVGSDSFTGDDMRRPSSRHISGASSPGALLQLTDEEACGVGQLAPFTNPGTFSIPTNICG